MHHLYISATPTPVAAVSSPSPTPGLLGGQVTPLLYSNDTSSKDDYPSEDSDNLNIVSPVRLLQELVVTGSQPEGTEIRRPIHALLSSYQEHSSIPTGSSQAQIGVCKAYDSDVGSDHGYEEAVDFLN